MVQMKIDYEKVSTIVTELKNFISSSQSKLEDLYTEAARVIEEYSGEEADALRELGETEKALMLEVCELLEKFVQSIQFITDELQNLDSTGAGHMSGGAVTPS